MRRLNPCGRRSGKRTLARRIALFAVGVAAVCCARTFHRSFRNGYPAEWNISKDKAEDFFSIKGGKVSYAAELDARTAKRGLWSSPSPINPYTWRKSKR